MRTKAVLNGAFEVTDQGDVYRIKNGQREPAKVQKTGRQHNYCVVSYTENGKQKHVYVHRLVAQAFIPNPNNYPQVNHLDGNPLNNAVENLEWCTPKMNVEHAYLTGLSDPLQRSAPCIRCGEPTMAKDCICPACKKELKSEAEKTDRLARIRDMLGTIDQSRLTETQKKYVNLRMEGLSFAKIAEICGVSRQCVAEAIRTSLVKTTIPKSLSKQEFHRLSTKLEKRRKKLAQLYADANLIEEEVILIEKKLRCQPDQAS